MIREEKFKTFFHVIKIIVNIFTLCTSPKMPKSFHQCTCKFISYLLKEIEVNCFSHSKDECMTQNTNTCPFRGTQKG